MAPELVTCKHCGFKFITEVKEIVNNGKTKVVRGLIDLWKKEPAGSEYIDIRCPKCSKWFEKKVE